MTPEGCLEVGIVDDDSDQSLLYPIFLGQDFRIHMFSDPHQALARFSANPFEYDAWLVDRRMPGMDGFALAEAMRQVRLDLVIGMVTNGGEGSLTDQDRTRRHVVDFVESKQRVFDFENVGKLVTRVTDLYYARQTPAQSP